MGKRAKGDSGSRQKGVSDKRDYTLITLVKIASRLHYTIEELLIQKYVWFLEVVEAVNYRDMQEWKYQALLHGAKKEEVEKMDNGQVNNKIEASWDDLADMGFGKKGNRFKKPKRIK